MYSLGIIFFEMVHPFVTGMERAEVLGKLRDPKPTIPLILKRPEMATQADVIISLVDHDASSRPSSSDLLSNDIIPEKVQGDKWARHLLRHAHKESYRKRFLATMFPQPDDTYLQPAVSNEIKPDAMPLSIRSNVHNGEYSPEDDDEESYPKVMSSELAYAEKGTLNIDSSDALLRSFVEENIARIFRRHGAIRLDTSALIPFSSQYLNKLGQTVKLIDPSGHLLQLIFDHTVPYASALARTVAAPRKTYIISDVYRATRFDGPPYRLGEAHFDIISSNYGDLGLREAEVIKVVDEVITFFPSMSTLQMCYHINHSGILNAILGFCNIHRSRWTVVKEALASLDAAQIDLTKIRSILRSPTIGIAATSVEELLRFNFRDVSDKAIPRLRSLLQKTDHLEAYFGHVEVVILYLRRLNVTRKVYISPLSSVNESFYRGNLFFQCIFDTPKKEVFAAGGRYDRLIESYKTSASSKLKEDTIHAVGFNFNWDRLCSSMSRFQRATAKTKMRKKAHHEPRGISLPNRCDVLVGSSEPEILQSTGLEIIQQLWANDISAELALDNVSSAPDLVYGATTESREAHTWSVYIKPDGNIKVRSSVKKEEQDVRASELSTWLQSEIRERGRTDGRSSGTKLYHHSSQLDGAKAVGIGAPEVRVVTSKTRSKKFNRKMVIEEGTVVYITEDLRKHRLTRWL